MGWRLRNSFVATFSSAKRNASRRVVPLRQSRVKRKGEEIERCAHLSLRTSAVRHPEDGSASVRAPSSPADSRAPREASYLFTLTQYLLGRIGEAVVRSRRQPISGTAPHSERPASRSFHGTHPLSFGIKIQSPVGRLIFSRLSRVIGF